MSNLNGELKALFDGFVDGVLRAIHESAMVALRDRGGNPKGANRHPAPVAKSTKAPPPKRRERIATKEKSRADRTGSAVRSGKAPRAASARDDIRSAGEGEITDPEELLRTFSSDFSARSPAMDARPISPRRATPAVPAIVQEPKRPTVVVREGETVLRVSTGGVVLRRSKRV